MSSSKYIKILFAWQVSNTLMLLWPARDELEDAAELVLSSIMAQALPSTIHIAASMDDMAHKVCADWCCFTLVYWSSTIYSPVGFLLLLHFLLVFSFSKSLFSSNILFNYLKKK